MLVVIRLACKGPYCSGATTRGSRYAFPAITAVAALAIGACLGLGRKRAVSLATGLVSSVIALTLASQWLTLSAFYT